MLEQCTVEEQLQVSQSKEQLEDLSTAEDQLFSLSQASQAHANWLRPLSLD